MFKLIKLFTTDVKKMQRNLSFLVFKAFKVREQYIFRLGNSVPSSICWVWFYFL